MALTFPLPFEQLMGLIGLEEGTFTLSRSDEVSGLGNGQPLNAELASPLWRFDGTTSAIENDDAEAVMALIEVLEQPGKDFYVANPRKLAPRSDPDGIKLRRLDALHTSKAWNDALIWDDAMPWGGAFPVPVVTIYSIEPDNRQLTLAGLPAGYVLSAGDMFAFEYGPSGQKRRGLHRLVSGATAGSNGRAGPIEVSSFIRTGAAVGDAVFLLPPAMRAKVIPGSVKPSAVGSLHQRISFSAIQKLR
jgi:hypothetical protein